MENKPVGYLIACPSGFASFNNALYPNNCPVMFVSVSDVVLDDAQVRRGQLLPVICICELVASCDHDIGITGKINP